MTVTWEDVRMTTGNLVAKLRAHRAAKERLDQARSELDEEIARVIDNGEWQIIDVAEVTGWSRETIRAIVKAIHKRQAESTNAEGSSSDSPGESPDS